MTDFTAAPAAGAPAAWIDLTHVLADGIPMYGGPGETPRFDPRASYAQEGYFARCLVAPEHAGTHVDAPLHFVPGGRAVADLPPASLVLPLVVIDVRTAAAAAGPDYAVTWADVERHERRFGPVPAGSLVAMWTGWDERWCDPERYRNADATGVPHFPGVSLSAARFLIDERRVAALGIDTLSTDPGNTTDFAEHRYFLGKGGYHVENLARLGQVPPVGATVVVGVLPLAGGSGAPARVLARLP